MKKTNLIIGKKQIILACLTLILGIAIYVNYVLSDIPTELKPTNIIEGAGGNYNDVAYVNGEGSDDSFAQARIDKMTKRDEAVETLQSIYNGGDLTENEKSVIAEKATAMSKLVEQENTVESLIKAVGFEDCVVYLDGTNASILVKSEGLLPSQAAQIYEILLSQVTIERENIRILDVK